RFVLRCGYTVERRWHDYGFDLTLTTYNENGESEGGEPLMQLKATDHLKLTADGSAVLFRIERADLQSWLEPVMPVILIVYDARADEAFWLYVQAYFDQQEGFDPTQGTQTV